MKTFILLILICSEISTSQSQIIKNFGLKGGYVFFSQHTYSIFGNNAGDGYEAGLFIEFPVYKKLTSVFEMHFSDKGTCKGSPGISSPEPFGYSDFVDITNRYQYLTFEALAKYLFSKNDYGLYGILGIRYDLLLKNYYTGYFEYFTIFSNGYFEFGPTLGIGYMFPFHILLEAQYNPNITYMLRYNQNGYIINFRNSSFVLFCGLSFK